MMIRLSLIAQVMWLAACGGPPAAPASAKDPFVSTTWATADSSASATPVLDAPQNNIDIWHNNHDDRQEAMHTLAAYDPSAFYADLHLLSTDPDFKVREQVMDVLLTTCAQTCPPLAQELIELTLSDPHPAVREAAEDVQAFIAKRVRQDKLQ